MADASIMPDLVTAPTNPAVLMIGERISDLVRQGFLMLRHRQARGHGPGERLCQLRELGIALQRQIEPDSEGSLFRLVRWPKETLSGVFELVVAPGPALHESERIEVRVTDIIPRILTSSRYEREDF